MGKPFTFGTSTVPDGKRGPWTIDSVTVDTSDIRVWMDNARAIRDGNPELVVPSGVYRRLYHKQRGVVMSNTPMEVNTAVEAYKRATGRVLINGLGLGMVLEGVLSKPDVTQVLVVEIDSDVIELVGPHFADDQRVSIHQGDAYTFEAGAIVWDYVWHDIWDDIDADNLPEMTKLKRKYAKHCRDQGCWSEKLARREGRRALRYG